jgi:hypothetical protein
MSNAVLSLNSSKDLPFSPSGLYTIPQIIERNPWLTESALRAQIFRAEELGLSEAIIRPAGQRKVLIHEPTYLERLRRQGSKK